MDYVVTHTAPRETILQMCHNPKIEIKRAAEEELALNDFLSEVATATEYSRWYFGHFHMDTATPIWREQYPVFRNIRALDSATIVQN